MIGLAGLGFSPNRFLEEARLSPMEKKIFLAMLHSEGAYVYPSLHTLRFELRLREATVESAKLLDATPAGFASFAASRCNPQYWNRTREGGFRLKEGVEPATALLDIFENGEKYAFECATAVVIVLYRSVLTLLGRETFNRLFAGLYLWDWKVDRDLGLTTRKDVDYYPGDILYFANPDYDPRTPHWQGENTILLDDNLYYGHGIGITTREEIIRFLNRYRKPGSSLSAGMKNAASRPSYRYLAQFSPEIRGAVLLS
ncbi:protein-glutamine gamma-glutamyltransferase [Thermicanus aegyptius]|uniref:protein-glutamine gamma-glutamyltransferase n=1 Tax=Thermicanus aegyptius TaxID=94009 RepID=UPI0004049C76|nr:protein-glutamine gamma-glutamyltransferase [Thermicanus aegyptius]